MLLERHNGKQLNAFEELPYYVEGRNEILNIDGKQIQYTWGNLTEVNQYNFRERDFETPKPSGVYRIMLLGDSFTWGTGLPVEKRYGNILENLLSDWAIENKINRKIEVLTFSTGGGNIDKYATYLKRFKDITNPDLIIIGMTYNDPSKKGWIDEGTRPKYKNEIIPRITRFLEGSNYFYSSFLKSKLSPDGIFNMLERVGVIPDPVEANWITGYDKEGKNWKNFIDKLAEIENTAIEITKQAPVIVYLTAPGSNIKESYYSPLGEKEALVQKMFAQVEPEAAKIGFIGVDVLPAFKEQLNGKYLALNIYDSHPNELCHLVYAEELKNKIIEKKLIKNLN